MRGIYGLEEQLLASQGRLRVLNLASRPLIVTVFRHDDQLASELNIDGKRVGMLTSLAFLTSVQRVETALSQFVTAFCLVFVTVRQTDSDRANGRTERVKFNLIYPIQRNPPSESDGFSASQEITAF